MVADVTAPLSESDAWRMAALSMMSAEELHKLFSSDPAEAAPWVIAAANGGLADAEVRLGRMLLSGEGIAKNEPAAVAWFERAAKSGNVDGHNMLGRCYENGWGAARDFAKAAEHFTVAANAGDAWAQYNLAHLYLDGLGVVRDVDVAFAWYSHAAEQGHVRAMSLVGRCYEEGWGVPPDTALAHAWYRKSAEGGYFRGAYNYASMLVSDDNIAEAAQWFDRALSTAPEPTRSNIVEALLRSPHAELRALVASGAAA